MAQLDTYLVEKLREILQRLYSGNKLRGFPQKEPDSLEEQQVAYKRSPLVFPYAPNLEMSSKSATSNADLLGVSETEANFLIEKRNREAYSDSETTTDSYYGSGQVVYNSSQPPRDSNYSETLTYGVEVNCTLVTEESSLNDTAIGNVDGDKISSEDESSALTRNLHEFIHILKMSLKSGATSFSSHENDVFQNRFGQPDHASETYGLNDRIGGSSGTITGSSDPFSGIEAASTTDMEFNLTLDDILDLNNLLEGNEQSSGIPLKHVVIIAIYFMIACVSIIGNLLVVQLVIRSRRFHTLTHALLANLAAADLFLATFNIPFSVARVIMSEWPFGSFLCRTVPFVQVTSVYATSFTMAVIAMDRYQVIMNPLGRRLKCSQGILLVIAIWIISGILSLPYALNHQVVTVLTVRIVKRCQAEFGSLRHRQLLTVATFLAQYLLPLLFTTVSYISIMKRLWYRSSGLGSTTPRQVAAQSRAKRKTIKMLVLTVICFALSWAPINIYHLLTHFSHVRPNSTAILLCHMIAMSSSMYNPFIFCGLNEHFRREAVKWLHCFRTRKSPTVHPGTEVNGMLTRADQVSRRNMVTTVIHTTSSCRRSPQHQQLTMSPRSFQQRRRNLASTTAAVYISPHHSNVDRTYGLATSPVTTSLVSCTQPTKNGGGPSGYQPELLFLVKSTIVSNDENVCNDEIESGDDMNAEEVFPDTLCDEWNFPVDYRSRYRDVNQSPRDNDDMFSCRESAAEDDDERDRVNECTGELETVN
ncbi:putative G-protein coupled receptor 83 [Orchesella cincta]|uniref:Putative G-protein coupled receptor 83 n=1 Tax=Orchesella cincta TaxID=48709 RepID=A0A1D2NI58_ORCCI|nr:putative G-protein coupled receptor 83 [Orchesella cincta]